jgi:hypothetical protein
MEGQAASTGIDTGGWGNVAVRGVEFLLFCFLSKIRSKILSLE